jgi:hypothetical protein
MNAKHHAIARQDFSRWFALFSPLIGALLGYLAVLIFHE